MPKANNVVELGAYRSQQKKEAEERPCSFSAISDKGNHVYGTAAFLVVSKRNGGIDEYLKSIANDAATVALAMAIKNGQRNFGGSIISKKTGIMPVFSIILVERIKKYQSSRLIFLLFRSHWSPGENRTGGAL